ncbi:hypothetical protein [Peribacillus butanolivorans]|nr:hypothetical protein [Peribacillus butanolivorans]
MFIHKIDEEVSLRLLNEDEAEGFYIKKWLSWLDSGRSSKGKAVPKTR